MHKTHTEQDRQYTKRRNMFANVFAKPFLPWKSNKNFISLVYFRCYTVMLSSYSIIIPTTEHI